MHQEVLYIVLQYLAQNYKSLQLVAPGNQQQCANKYILGDFYLNFSAQQVSISLQRLVCELEVQLGATSGSF